MDLKRTLASKKRLLLILLLMVLGVAFLFRDSPLNWLTTYRGEYFYGYSDYPPFKQWGSPSLDREDLFLIEMYGVKGFIDSEGEVAPAISYLKELTPAQFTGMGISLSDMRISVGLENEKDLVEDLKQALGQI